MPFSRMFDTVRDVLCGVIVIVVLWFTSVPDDDGARAAQLFLAGMAFASVLARRRFPTITVVVSLVATGTAWAAGLTFDPFVLAGWCVFSLAEQRGKRRFPWSVASGSALVLLLSLGLSAEGTEERSRGLLLSAVVISASWALGVRTRQARVDAAERSRIEERLRLARDVHDVLSHSLGVIGVRAGVAAHVGALGEEELRTVLREIEGDARGSLQQLKIHLQRERSLGQSSDTASNRPLAVALADVARSAESAGIAVGLTLSGDVESLPAATATTIQRVAQEAVTNVVRHASASTCAVTVAVSAENVSVEVRDDGRAALSPIREGHGLTGMRERVALMGGTVQVISEPGGFAVCASLPLRETEGRTAHE